MNGVTMCPALHFTVHTYHLQIIGESPFVQRNAALCGRTTYKHCGLTTRKDGIPVGSLH